MPWYSQGYRFGNGSEKEERTKQGGTGNLERLWGGASEELKGVTVAIYPFHLFFLFIPTRHSRN
jgi:hypothetical protein